MELLQGESVAQRLERVRQLDYAATHRLVAHVARALTRAHAIGIVHRDLKPENVYLVPNDDGEVAKVLDFGVAKWSSDWAVSSVTKTGLLVGTPLYMSPEQARGTKEIDFRADLWSLAVMTFQALTGELPFLSEGLGDLLAKIMFEPIPLPSSIVPSLPPGLDAWWVRAASRDIEARYQSAKELSDALAIALGLSNPTTVAEVPVGFRETAMSDYSLSLGDESNPPAARGVLSSFWPASRGGKLLGGGVMGVVLIAATMSFRARDEKKAAQTLVTPPASVASVQTPHVEPTPSAKVEPKPAEVEPPKAAERIAPPTKADRPDEPSPRRARPAPPPPKAAAPHPAAPPSKSKVDFGI
jgi:serine/threonine protein kinase